MTRRVTRRPRRLLLLGAIALGGGALSACGSSGANALGAKACGSVNASLRDYAAAGRATGAARAGLLAKAQRELRDALPNAALAATEDGTDWQALAATLSETNRVSEGDLIQALNAQCQS